jgi:cytochrome b561
MMERHRRFTAWQRVLHWLMAACILAMLFIGVGMVADLSDARFDPQTARHRHSGARADPLGAPPALWCAVAAGRLA